MSTKSTEEQIAISRLEAEAVRSPRRFRIYLAMAAVAGDLALTTVQVLPIAISLVVGALFLNREFFYWLTGAAILFFAWLTRPTIRFEGRELQQAEAPQLFAELTAMRQKLRVSGHMQVFLDDSFNASAAESKGLFGLLGTRRALTLGLPLLAVLSRNQVLAIIGHEFGHFSRRHGRLGHWIYRARAGWIAFARQVDSSDALLDRAAAWYADIFVPWFSRRSFVHSRTCEYEADADSALAMGSNCTAEALSRLLVMANYWSRIFPLEISRWQIESAMPPADLFERFAKASQKCSASDLQLWLNEALREPSSLSDTHPSLAQRLRALGEKPALASASDSAGEVLLGASWQSIVREFDSKWVRDTQGDWLAEHLHFRHISKPLLDADETTVKNWNAERRLAYARALRRTDPSAGLGALELLHAEQQPSPQTRFAYGTALLNEDKESGVAIMESLAKEFRAFRFQIYRRLLIYFERRGDDEQVARLSARIAIVARTRSEAIGGFWTEADSGKADASTLPREAKNYLCDVARVDPCVERACALESQRPNAVRNSEAPTVSKVYALAIVLDPMKLKDSDQDEEQIADRYRSILTGLISADQIASVRTFFKTEPIPTVYGPDSKYLLAENLTTGNRAVA